MAPTITNRSQQAALASSLGSEEQIGEERTLSQYYINKTQNFDPREHYLSNLNKTNRRGDVNIHDMARIAADQLSRDMTEQGISGEEQMRTITEMKNYALARYGDLEIDANPKIELKPDYQIGDLPQDIPQPLSNMNGEEIQVPNPQQTRIPLPQLERIPNQQALSNEQGSRQPFQISPNQSLALFSLAESLDRHREIFLEQMRKSNR